MGWFYLGGGLGFSLRGKRWSANRSWRDSFSRLLLSFGGIWCVFRVGLSFIGRCFLGPCVMPMLCYVMLVYLVVADISLFWGRFLFFSSAPYPRIYRLRLGTEIVYWYRVRSP